MEEANRIIGLLMKLVIFLTIEIEKVEYWKSNQTKIKESWWENSKQTQPPQATLAYF